MDTRMRHRGTRLHRDRGRETPDHLTADRLSDIVRAPPSQSCESIDSIHSLEAFESSEPSESSGSLESLRPSESSGPFWSVRARRAVRSLETSASAEHSESSVALESSDSSGSYQSVEMRATRGAPERMLTARPFHLRCARGRQLDGPETAVVLTAGTETAGELFIVPNRTGRHRRPPSAMFRVWYFGFTSRRLALIGLPALFVFAVIAVLAVR